MDKYTVTCEELNDYIPPPGEPIPGNIEHPPLSDEASEDAEILRVIVKSGSGRSGVGSKMRAEDLKTWLRNIEHEEKAEAEGKYGLAGMGDAW
jgi:hypothetical protein